MIALRLSPQLLCHAPSAVSRSDLIAPLLRRMRACDDRNLLAVFCYRRLEVLEMAVTCRRNSGRPR